MRRVLPGLIGLSSMPKPVGVPDSQWIGLPDDAPAKADSVPEAGGALHWAPLRHGGLRSRMARIADWIQTTAPDVLVVDVSVEVAVFARLMGTPVVWIGQRGTRIDPPHQLAYRCSRVAVPWTEAVASGDTGLPTAATFVGAVSRFDDLTVSPAPGKRNVALLIGGGGHRITAEAVRAAQAATPAWSWRSAGVDAEGGPTRDPQAIWTLLQSADVVVGSAGTNVVAEVAAARRPFVCLPQARPFDEQLDQAAALRRADLAITLNEWPAASEWPALLDTAVSRDAARWSLLHDGQGAERLAAVIAEAACASA